MLEFFRKLFATDFMPHVYCLRLPEVVWLHVVSDTLIAGSYFFIPAALILLIRRRRDIAFSWMFALFGLFILACGATHVLSVYTLWYPVYRFDGLVKAVTAFASVPTAIILFRLLPQVVALPSPAQLRAEIDERRNAEVRIRDLNTELEQRVAERTAALVDSEARFRAAAQAASDIIWTNSADGRMLGEQLDWGTFTGQTFEEYQGYGWAASLHPHDAQPTIDAWNEAVAQRKTFVFEHRVRRHDGVWRLLSVRAVPVLNEKGDIREWVGVHSDITEEREIREDLQRAKSAAEAANRAKSAFLASMSHELRTPLNAIIGYSEMLQEEAEEAGAATLVPDMKRVHTAGKHLLSLINDVLDLSKIEAGRMELFVESFPVADAIREVTDTAAPLIERNSNKLLLQIAPDLGVMSSDIGKLRQCLLNLLSNAAKFTEKGLITLNVHAEGEGLVFQVKDTGIGMDAKQLGRLFEPFMQGDGSTARRFGGTGLGLALTRRLCHMMGGDVTASSESGHGSEFTIRVPRLAPATGEVSPASITTTTSVAKADNCTTVLVIDDDPAARDLVGRLVEKEGYTVVTAADGAEGLRLARSLHPAAITLDVIMPGMDGWTVLSSLKSDPELSHIPVIMLSMVDDRGRSYAFGAADYLTKPVDRERLAAVLKKYACTSPPYSVLVVDDEEETRILLQRLLEHEDWHVLQASDGHSALQTLEYHQPQLILLDLMMPGMDGFAFTDELIKRGSQVPIVVLTAKELTADDRTRLQGHVERILAKGEYAGLQLINELRRVLAPTTKAADAGEQPR